MRRLLLVLALAVLAAACAGGEPAAGPTAAPEPAASEAPAATPRAPAAAAASEQAGPGPTDAGGTAPFEGTVATVDGGTLAGADFVRRDVALWFWAPW